jgi:hypothetical protein
MSGTALATSAFASSDMQQDHIEGTCRDIVENVIDSPANLEIELQTVQQELADAQKAIEQVPKMVVCVDITFIHLETSISPFRSKLTPKSMWNP